MGADIHEEIRWRAFEIWENEGCPVGADVKHWLQAEDELLGDDEHETMQELIDEDDRDDDAVERGVKTSAETLVPEVEITTGEKQSDSQISKTEGP
ncbi:DUF2934 domain-containing protein [Rhizobium cauense]|uniref:DUF2934 domain-containing protein n=1 Tax=Rhizobium cauense TaxID=1166683 RepID=UPI001C6E5B15|nr:DUF2934 domain-containing protein [Rhizobium cauense]MBW9113528.1 DUF2934 domain-containing protein [Rhizobium cauense]